MVDYSDNIPGSSWAAQTYERSAWIAREAELWRALMDPRASHAEGWKLYDLWIHH